MFSLTSNSAGEMVGPSLEETAVPLTIEMMKCSICKEFTERVNMRRHLLEHFPNYETQHMCDTCGKNFRTVQELKNHKLTHEEPKWACSFCDARLYCKGSLTKHIAAVHTKESVKKCDICFESLCNQRYLDKHMFLKHGVPLPFQCEKCGKNFVTEKRFTMHTIRGCDAKRDITKNHRCDQCDYTTTRPGHLKSHKEAVHENNVYNCEHCGFQSGSRQNLKQHVRTVHEGPKHFCSQCHYSTTRPGNLKAHIQAVHQKVRVTCRICNHTASDQSNMRKHMIKAHNALNHLPSYSASEDMKF